MRWQSYARSSHWLVSPHLQAWQRRVLADIRKRVPVTTDTIWILSSGTRAVDTVKCIGLTREAILCSADGVNRHLASTRKDRWLLTLPVYHIGGFSILARAHLSGAKVFKSGPKWNAGSFAAQVGRDSITLTSLVPAQVYDLVAGQLRSPSCLRAAVVGGGALEPDLYRAARKLGWPLLPSYGLTECASQVATAGLKSLQSNRFPALEVLPHVQVKIREHRLWLKSKAVARWIATGHREGQFTLEEPAPSGWYASEDRAEIKNGRLKILGRLDDVVKILGTLVSIPDVETAAKRFFGLDESIAVLACSSSREGHRLVLVTDSAGSLGELEKKISAFNVSQPGPQRLHQLIWLSRIPTGELGKVKRTALAKLLNVKLPDSRI